MKQKKKLRIGMLGILFSFAIVLGLMPVTAMANVNPSIEPEGAGEVREATFNHHPQFSAVAKNGYAFEKWVYTFGSDAEKSSDSNPIMFDTEPDSIKAVFIQTYPLWVNGVQVTSKNQSDVLSNDPENKGKVSYYPAKNAGSAYLALNGVNITKGYKGSGIYYNGTDGLWVSLTGDTKVSGVDYGLRLDNSEGGTSIIGEGSFTADVEICGIYSEGNLTIDGAIVNSTSSNDTYAIYSNKAFQIREGIVTATAKKSNSFGISSSTVYLEEGCKLTASGEAGAINGTVRNDITGIGWTDVKGTKGEADIPVSDKGQTLNYCKVQFPGGGFVSYDSNGATGGEVPTDSTSYKKGDKVTVHGNTGNLVKTGCKFADWNTMADGAGINYAAGDTFEIKSDTELYAQWKHDDTIYKAGDKFSLIDSAYYKLGDEIVTGEKIKDEYSITTAELSIESVEYNAEAKGVVISFPNTQINVLIPAQSTSDPSGFIVKGSGTQSDPYTFIAVYDKTSVTLTYDGNGNTSGAVPAEAKSYEAGETVTVLDNTGNLVKTDNTFDGWNTKADGTGNAYKAGDTFAISENTTLYAQWKKYDPQTEYKVTVDVLGHGTAPVDQIVKDGDKATKPADPTAEGYSFEGWFKEIECTNAWDFDTAVTSDITLFAKWTEVQPEPAPEPTPTPTDTGVTVNPAELALTVGGGKKLEVTTVPADAKVTFTSDNTAVASVDNDGMITAKAAGETVVTAAITVDNVEYKGKCTVVVTPAGGDTEYVVVPEALSDDNLSEGIVERYGNVEEVIVTIKEVAGVAPEQTGNFELFDAQIKVIENGVARPATAADIKSEGLEAIFPYPEGTNKNQVFEGVHMIGEDSGGYKAGDTEQLAFTNEDDGLHATVHGLSPVIITWKDPTPVPTEAGITLSASEIYVTQSRESAITATIKPEDAKVTWSSSDTSVARVDGTGVVSGIKPGTATITATITVDGKEYTASCKVTVIPAGSPMPIPVPSGSHGGGEHVHKYVWKTIEATEDTDGELRYQCETCGDIKERVPLTAYNVFNKNATEKIRNAKKDATVKIETSKWISFHKMVMEALAERPDVTLEISFLDEGHKGKRCTVTIPKGTDTKPLVDKNGFTGFLFLGSKFGMKTN